MDTLAQLPKYNLNEEQEKKLILREYRALLRGLKTKLKPGDKRLSVLPLKWQLMHIKPCAGKAGNPIFFIRSLLQEFVWKKLGLGVRSTICSLLHDTVEDTDISLGRC